MVNNLHTHTHEDTDRQHDTTNRGFDETYRVCVWYTTVDVCSIMSDLNYLINMYDIFINLNYTYQINLYKIYIFLLLYLQNMYMLPYLYLKYVYI